MKPTFLGRPRAGFRILKPALVNGVHPLFARLLGPPALLGLFAIQDLVSFAGVCVES